MYCTQCGEYNPAGSSKCAKCGSALAPLPAPGVAGGRRCPMCGKVNVPEAVFCAACGARVLPLEDVNEEELDFLNPAPPPTRLSVDAQMALNYERQHELFTTGEDPELDPDLERRLTAPPDQQSHSLFVGRPPPRPDHAFSWLDALRGDADEPAPGDQDGTAEPATPPAAPPAPAAEPELPAWMTPPAPAAQAGPPPAAEPELPAWMTPPAPATEAPSAEPALPAWLNAPSARAASPSAAEPALPAWLNPPPARPAPPSPPAEPDRPAWLNPPPVAGTPAPPPGPAAPAGPSLPAWLSPAAGPSQDVEPSLPAWLQSTPAPPAAPPAMEPAPPWLSSFDEPAPGPGAPASPAAASGDADAVLPPWLRGMDAEAPPAAPAAATPPPAEAAAPAAPAVDESGLPWLSAFAAPEAESAAPAPAEPATAPLGDIELPSWLRAAASAPPPPPPLQGRHPITGKLLPLDDDSTPPAAPDVPPPVPAAEDGLPAWMSAPEADTAATPDAPLAEDSFPTWMTGSPTATAQPPAPPPPAGDDSLPAWRSGPPAPAPAEAPAAPAPAAEADGFPAWMSGSPAPTPAAETPAPAPTGGADGFPAWMSGPPAATGGAEAPAEALPPWLAGPGQAPSQEAGAASVPAPAAPAGGSPFLSEEDLPAWLRALQTPATPRPAVSEATSVLAEPPPAPGAAAAEAATEAPAASAAPETPPVPTPVPVVPEAPPAPQPVAASEEELPAWLRALSSVEEELAPAAALETAGSAPLATVRVLRARAPRPGAVAVFERLLAPPVEAPAAPIAKRSMMSRVFTDRLVHLLLLAVVVVMWLLAPQFLDPSTVTTPQTAAGGTFYNTLVGLPASKPVLLVYDWDASRYGEMYPLSVAVTRVLSDTGHSLATISTIPEGTGFALQVTSAVLPQAATGPDCGAVGSSYPNPWPGAYGTNYLHLGYLPGNESGLAQLATANVLDVAPYDLICNHGMGRAPLIQHAPTLAQFGAIVLLAGGDHPLRLWIEQVASRLHTSPDGTDGPALLAALPQSLEPAAKPYLNLDSGNARLRGAVFGVVGAQEIAQRLDEGPQADANATTDRTTLGQTMHTESAALYFLALALLVGFVASIFRWINRRSAT